MISITLPATCLRAELRSFWTCISVGFGLAFVPIFLSKGWAISVGVALIVATLSGCLLFVNEQFVRRVYSAWNRRLVRPMSRRFARCIMGICYFIVFLATRQAGARLFVPGESGSSWKRRNLLEAANDTSLFVGRALGTQKGWIRPYVEWAGQTGNSWSIALIPFLWLLRPLAPAEEKSHPGNIYTLF